MMRWDDVSTDVKRFMRFPAAPTPHNRYTVIPTCVDKLLITIFGTFSISTGAGAAKSLFPDFAAFAIPRQLLKHRYGTSWYPHRPKPFSSPHYCTP
jgi:hypothetical protein